MIYCFPRQFIKISMARRWNSNGDSSKFQQRYVEIPTYFKLDRLHWSIIGTSLKYHWIFDVFSTTFQRTMLRFHRTSLTCQRAVFKSHSPTTRDTLFNCHCILFRLKHGHIQSGAVLLEMVLTIQWRLHDISTDVQRLFNSTHSFGMRKESVEVYQERFRNQLNRTNRKTKSKETNKPKRSIIILQTK